MKKAMIAISSVIALTSAINTQAAKLPTQTYLDLNTSITLAEEALNSCLGKGYNVSVAVVDASGVTRAIMRADKAGPHTLESSRKKAFTSASMGRPTADFANLIKKKPQLAGLRDMDPNILILGGGLPIKVKGQNDRMSAE